MADQENYKTQVREVRTTEGSGTGMALIVGGLVVAVFFVIWLVFGGDGPAVSTTPTGDTTNVTVEPSPAPADNTTNVTIDPAPDATAPDGAAPAPAQPAPAQPATPPANP